MSPPADNCRPTSATTSEKYRSNAWFCSTDATEGSVTTARKKRFSTGPPCKSERGIKYLASAFTRVTMADSSSDSNSRNRPEANTSRTVRW